MMLEAVDLGVDIDDQPILDAESVGCPQGAMTALVGPSGSGKTTLLHCLGLLQQPTRGEVLVDGSATRGWGSSRRRRFWRDHASFVLQDYGIMLEEQVAFNVTMTSRLWGRGAAGDPGRLRDALAATGLSGREDEVASHLSGGERQRLAVARSIYKQARVILVDEPTASLDDVNRDVVIELFRERAREGCTVVIATHDPVAIAGCDLSHQVGARHGALVAGR
jgi:putative ABC transport system ATP-binding protein